MPKIKIDRDKCKGCELCVLYCPRGLIKIESSLNNKGIHPALFKGAGFCSGCAFCAQICPDVCIEVYK